jgi:hypothetical protein
VHDGGAALQVAPRAGGVGQVPGHDLDSAGQLTRPIRPPHESPDTPALGEELARDMASDESRAAGEKEDAHRDR